MKIGIITFHNIHDYGSVLQAWSLQQYLKQQGHNVEIVNLRFETIEKKQRLTFRTHRKITGIKKIDKWINNVYYNIRVLPIRILRPAEYKNYIQFENFICSELSLTREYTTYEKLERAKIQYDVLIAGGHEIWNADILNGINRAYFLQFANENAIRISYAASLGADHVPSMYQLIFQRYLREFDALSVREKGAQESVEKLTDLEVAEVVDPTLLLEKEDYDQIKEPTNIRGNYIYVHSVQSDNINKTLKEVGQEVSQKAGFSIVHNLTQNIFDKEKDHFNGTVGEFLDVISNADYVVTDSFYCMMFAIIYEKDFLVVSNVKTLYSVQNLLEELDLTDHLIIDAESVPLELSDIEIDYSKVNERLVIMRKNSQSFLLSALKSKRVKNNKNYLEYPDIFRCYGCCACRDSCPAGAISMEEDKEGFQYPVVDKEKCIHCDTCKKVCPYHRNDLKNKKTENFPIVYAAYHKDRNVLETSRCGGVFTALYHSILKKEGEVVGVTFDKSMRVVYAIADTETDCARFRGYKYVSPDICDIMKQTKSILEEGRYVLFSGIPCQIAGLKSYLGKEYETLYTVEMLCRGMSSPKVFRKYIEYLEQIYQSPVVDFQFQNKFKGLNQSFILCKFASESLEIENSKTNNFSANYIRCNIDRPSCYTCEYADLKYGVADITIGNYRKLRKSHRSFGEPGGVSILKINTRKGQELFEGSKDELNLCESTYKDAYAGYTEQPIPMSNVRTKLMYYIDEKPIDKLLQTFNPTKKGGFHGLS